jgi:hypothetical protein
MILENSNMINGEKAKELNKALEEYQKLDTQIKDLKKSFDALKDFILKESADGTNQTMKVAWDIIAKSGSEKVVSLSKIDSETIDMLRKKDYIMETKGSRSIGKIRNI